MPATLLQGSENEVVLEVRVPLGSDMLANEEAIQQALHQAGNLATQQALERFDTDGAPIVVGNRRLKVRAKMPKEFQTPYGSVVVERYVYQASSGGRVYIPLDQAARIVVTSTPKLAKTLCHKYAALPGVSKVVEDLEQNHGRHVAPGTVQRVADAVATVCLAKEETWAYALPELAAPVASIGVGLDGACMMLVNDGWREAMTGTLALYDGEGTRLHTTYLAASPEYGKAAFLASLERELGRMRALFPAAVVVGLADGAASNWTFLETHTDVQTVDFYHVSTYLATAAAGVFLEAEPRRVWLDDACHRLKHQARAPTALLDELRGFLNRTLRLAARQAVQAAVTYFENQHARMTYAQNVAQHLPLGSGVTEAACKVIVKERMCISGGRRWTERGASTVLSLRCLTHTRGRWQDFWAKISRYGVSCET